VLLLLRIISIRQNIDYDSIYHDDLYCFQGISLSLPRAEQSFFPSIFYPQPPTPLLSYPKQQARPPIQIPLLRRIENIHPLYLLLPQLLLMLYQQSRHTTPIRHPQDRASFLTLRLETHSRPLKIRVMSVSLDDFLEDGVCLDVLNRDAEDVVEWNGQ
jgi:hypothetical protein